MANFKYKTTSQIIVFNTIILMICYMAWLQGYVTMAIAADPTHIIFIITTIVAITIGLSIKHAITIDQELFDISESVKKHKPYTPQTLRDRFALRYSFAEYAANLSVGLGLLATVIGYIVSFSGFSVDTVTSVANLVYAIVPALAGMGIAFYATLFGLAAAVWIETNILIVHRAIIKLYDRMINHDA